MNFLKFGAIAILCVSFTGCVTTPSELMTSTPDAVHTSVKSVTEVAQCIERGWEEVKLPLESVDVSIKKMDTGIRISSRYGKELHYVAMVTNRESGSRTQLWTYKVIGASGAKEVKDAQKCQ